MYVKQAVAYLTIFPCVIEVKLQNPLVEKGQTDKSFGDCKKLDAASSSCQCVCHNSTNLSASAADQSAVIDPNVSACKEPTPPPPAVAGQSRCHCSSRGISRIGQFVIFN